jgi:2-succinyl-5-enolpyruvyl-6-hydroxy-3-cyclohexene-1-carboxylate synthase
VPKVVLQVGAAPTSRAGLELVRRAERLLVLDPDHLVADPHRKASITVCADLGALVPELVAAVNSTVTTTWWSEWFDADRAVRTALDAELDRGDEPFEGRIARDLAASVPDGSVLVVGSSLPVRDLDAYMAPRDGLAVLANRGASGIDGFLSTAFGAAAASERPTTALCGDLTFLYDAGSLLWSALRAIDLVVVVLNNRGGAIFSLLAQRELPELEELFVTPHGLDLGAVCVAARAGHTRITRASELIPTIEAGRANAGVQVVEVMLDPDRNLRRRDEVKAAVGRALAQA